MTTPFVKVTNFPKEIESANQSDFVTYTAYETKAPKHCVNSACYATHMTQLDKLSFKLEPTASYRASSKETFLEWIAICKKVGLIPEAVLEYVEDEKNYLWIPAKIYDRHTVYMIMCCYRWSASSPKMIWQLVEHVKLNPKITFWQILHFALATWSGGSGHSFSNICKGVYNNSRMLLSQSLAIKYFCEKPFHARPKKQGYTCSEMDGIAKELDPKQKCLIKSIDDVLSERWVPLFELADLDANSVQATYEKLSK